jgi:ABC-type dipeptide/oligopeptide/nickel transport system permease subunit
LFVSIFGGLLPLPKWDEYDFDAFGVGMFSKGHIFGTDFDGQDVLAQLVHGTRMSLVISFVSVLAASVIGGVLGIIAAYRRGWVDSVITMYFNVTLSIPTLILVLPCLQAPIHSTRVLACREYWFSSCHSLSSLSRYLADLRARLLCPGRGATSFLLQNRLA